MNYKICLVIITCFLSTPQVLSYSDTLNFISPVDHQIRLTGNFMEIRTNHFHSGIDIKSSKGTSGDNIKAVADGYISRIKILSGSYGNALYIDHPSGQTSVYGHLDHFNEAIESYVKDFQYKYESFEIDIYLPPGIFKITQNEIIGVMGNTGRSFGPHLHFELRNSLTEEPINPQLLGIGPTDSKSPVIERLHVYELGSDSELLDSEVKYFNPKRPSYELYDSEVLVNSNYIGLGLQMYDIEDGSWNRNGIYGYRLYVDNKIEFSWEADAYSFDENRYINGFVDYKRLTFGGQKVYLLYKQNCSSFSFYKDSGSGIIDMSNVERRKIRLETYDLHNNISAVEFDLIKAAGSKIKSNQLAYCDSTLMIHRNNFNIVIPAKTFFSPLDLEVKESFTEHQNAEWPTLTIANSSIPVSQYYDIIALLPEQSDTVNWTLVSTDEKGRFIHFGGIVKNGHLHTKVDKLGDFFLYQDNISPRIEIVNMDSSLKSSWKFRISDNLIPDGLVPNLNYKASINNKWVRLKYDLKNKMLIFNDFEQIPNGSFHFKLIVTDFCNNTTELDRSF